MVGIDRQRASVVPYNQVSAYLFQGPTKDTLYSLLRCEFVMRPTCGLRCNSNAMEAPAINDVYTCVCAEDDVQS